VSTRARSERGFTLPELLVAITILGIIMGAIGAMIVTAFRTTSTVSSELNASRGPKMVSRYWVPDVEQARDVLVGAGECGSGDDPIVTLRSPVYSSAFDDPNPLAPAGLRVVTYWETTSGTRRQLVRAVCDGTAGARTIPVVADLDSPAPAVSAGAPTDPVSITVHVPDLSQGDEVYDFTVAAARRVTEVGS
jgi:prepilin-type N-terminal cleavage/methylation domain-containing protein